MASSGRKKRCDFLGFLPEAQLKLEAKAPMSGTPKKIDPEIGMQKFDEGKMLFFLMDISRTDEWDMLVRLVRVITVITYTMVKIIA